MLSAFTSFRFTLILAGVMMLSVACSGDPIEKRNKHMARATEYFNGEEYKKAIIEYKNAIQADPKFSQAHFQLAQAYLRTQQPRQAFSEFQRTVDLAPDNLEAHLRMGQFFLLGKKPEEAFEKSQLILEKEPDNVEALFLKMGAHLQQEQSSEAIAALNHIVAVDKNNTRAYMALARIAAQEKHFEKAQRYLSKAIHIQPEDKGVGLELARLYEQQGKGSEAEQEIKRLIARHPEDLSLLNSLAGFYIRNGRLDLAETTYIHQEAAAPDKTGPKITLGAFYASKKDWDKAISWTAKALELEPDRLDIKGAMASLYCDSGDLDTCERLVSEILEKDEKNLLARFTKGRLLFLKKQWDEAATMLRGVVSEKPDHPGAQYQLGLVYTALRDRNKAKGAFLKTVELDPGHDKARIFLAQAYLSERQPDLALEQIGLALADNPRLYEGLMVQARAYTQKQEYEKAKKSLLEARSMRPQTPAPYYQLALIDHKLGNRPETEAHVAKVLALQPDHLRGIALKIALLTAEKKDQEALGFLHEKIEASKENQKKQSLFYEMEGAIHLSRKDYEKSEVAFQKALSLNPDLVAPYVSLARLYLAKDETAKAISQYEEILEKRPRFIQAHMALGAIYDATGDVEKAKTSYENALQIKSDFAPAANNLAWILLQQEQDYDRALALAKQAKTEFPDDPSVADTIGLAYLVNGLHASAVAEFSDAAEKLPENPTVLYHLGLAHWKNSNREEALEALKTALSLKRPFPEQTKAALLLEEIEAS